MIEAGLADGVQLDRSGGIDGVLDALDVGRLRAAGDHYPHIQQWIEGTGDVGAGGEARTVMEPLVDRVHSRGPLRPHVWTISLPMFHNKACCTVTDMLRRTVRAR